MSKQYLRKREYLGIMEINYILKYGRKIVNVTMKWISGEYRILWAKLIRDDPIEYVDDFPYKRTVATIDRVEALLNMFKEEVKK